MKKLALISMASLVLGIQPVSAADTPVVVELFTSQGCSSCPPADKVLADLAQREDVIALSWAVDYWDYLGWKDIFASRAHTLRQRAYNESFGRQIVYTPQMVVDGETQLIGSRRNEAMEAIKKHKDEGASKVDVKINKDADGHLKVSLSDADMAEEAIVRLVWFDNKKVVDVGRGENRGRQLSYSNIVRGSQVLGRFSGQATAFELRLEDAMAMGCDGVVVIVQRDPAGPVLGAAKLAL